MPEAIAVITSVWPGSVALCDDGMWSVCQPQYFRDVVELRNLDLHDREFCSEEDAWESVLQDRVAGRVYA